jgi:hypothetical protein
MPDPPLTAAETAAQLQLEPGVSFKKLNPADVLRALEVMEQDMRLANQAVRTLRVLGFMEGRQWEEACAAEDREYQRYMLAVRQQRIPASVLARVSQDQPSDSVDQDRPTAAVS